MKYNDNYNVSTANGNNNKMYIIDEGQRSNWVTINFEY